MLLSPIINSAHPEALALPCRITAMINLISRKESALIAAIDGVPFRAIWGDTFPRRGNQKGQLGYPAMIRGDLGSNLQADCKLGDKATSERYSLVPRFYPVSQKPRRLEALFRITL
jgi:hypothetical protein